MPLAWELSRCKANIPAPMVPHGIYGCQAGWVSIILAVWKMVFTPSLFCQMEQHCGRVFWAGQFLTVAWYWTRMKHSYCMIGQSLAHLWKLDGRDYVIASLREAIPDFMQRLLR